jgi:uncharacterized protein YunC (DUF1805 family)
VDVDKSVLTVNERHAWSVRASLADTIKVSVQELVTANLEALLDDLGSVLIHAVFGAVTKNVVDGAAAISGSTVFADMLNAPVAELAVGNDINAG